ncbi:hypothetical protein [Bacillus sp. SM2101]|uniref:hypothetical protein n=1 Tax=Bacillus sp. SM2101 TaxID=2805366 RepID=UPI001BDE088A|nr:hypothetical protein [Bacillus sp. SM2101]
MHITHYYCDSCKEEVENDRYLTPIKLSVVYPGHTYDAQKHVCKSCLGSIEFESGSKYSYFGDYLRDRFFNIVNKVFGEK